MAEVIWAKAPAKKTDILSTLAAMNPSEIPDRLRAAGRSQAELSRHLGLDPSSLTKTIKGTRRMKADELVKLAAFLGEDAPASFASAPSTAISAPAHIRRVPVYGYAAAGGEDRIALNEGQVIDWLEGPPGWIAGDEFAVRVIGTSMEPRLFEGEKVICRRLLPPARWQDVVVEFEDGSGVIKTYINQKDGFVNCEQWNDKKALAYSLTGAGKALKVKALHAVIWRR